MAAFKVAALIVFVSLPAFGKWGLIFQSGGFLGRLNAGILISWEEKHAAEISLGTYLADNREYHQLNVGYRWSPWIIVLDEKTKWSAIQVGGFLIGSLDRENFFTESPDTFPENYYDQNAIRGGLQLASSLFFSDSVAITAHMMILESGLIAIFNNKWDDLPYVWATGLGLQVFF